MKRKSSIQERIGSQILSPEPSTTPCPQTCPDDLLNSSSELRIPTDVTRREQALARLNVTESQIARTPEIKSILQAALKNGRKGASNEAVIGYLRFSEDPRVQSLLDVYDEMNKGDRNDVPIEALCLRARVETPLVLGLVIMCARNLSAQESALQTIIEHPEVVKSTIDFAKNLPGASKDREMIHQAVGYLPTSKGQTISFNLLNGNPQKEQAEDETDDDNESFTLAFPSVNESLEKWSGQRNKLLDKGK